MSDQHQRTRIGDLVTDLHAASTEAYDGGHHSYGHMLERAGLLIEDFDHARSQALKLLEPAADRSTAVCRAIDSLEEVDVA